jgi:hypothetical protein
MTFNFGFIVGKCQNLINTYLDNEMYKAFFKVNIWRKHQKLRVYLSLVYPDREEKLGYVSFEKGIQEFPNEFMNKFEGGVFVAFVTHIRGEYGVISTDTRQNLKKVTRRKKEINLSETLEVK